MREIVQDRFTNGLRRVATAEEVTSKWGGGDKLHCYLCNHNFVEGEGWRWIYMNSDPSPSFGNFMVCDSCDGLDVKQRWVAANALIQAHFKERINSEGDWPTAVVAKLLKKHSDHEATVRELRELVRDYRESEDHAFCEDAGVQDGMPTRDVRCKLCIRADRALGQ